MQDKHKSIWFTEVVDSLAPAVYSEVQDLSRLRRARYYEPPQNKPPPAEIRHRAGVVNSATLSKVAAMQGSSPLFQARRRALCHGSEPHVVRG